MRATPKGKNKMNMAEQLDAVRDILMSREMCAEQMITEIETIVFNED